MYNLVNRCYFGDVAEIITKWPDEFVHVVCCSPPYWGLRDYKTGSTKEIGTEASIAKYIDNLVRIFAQVRRVLRSDGVCIVNLGDTYSGGGRGKPATERSRIQAANKGSFGVKRCPDTGFPKSEPLNIPHKVAEALRNDGWHWRETLVWWKTNSLPSSVNGTRWERCRQKVEGTTPSDWRERAIAHDGLATGAHGGNTGLCGGQADFVECPGCPKCTGRPGIPDGWVLRLGSWRRTICHEYIFVFSKSHHYFADKESVREPFSPATLRDRRCNFDSGGRNPRSVVWAKEPDKDDSILKTATEHATPHYAVYPRKLVDMLIRPYISRQYCSICNSPFARMLEKRDGVLQTVGWLPTCQHVENKGGGKAIVFDPFLGSGTTALVARELGADWLGCELNAAYAKIQENRLRGLKPLAFKQKERLLI